MKTVFFSALLGMSAMSHGTAEATSLPLPDSYYKIEGIVEKELPCIYGGRSPDFCLRIWASNGGLYYLVGSGPEDNSITYEPVYDLSEIDDAGYPKERYLVSDSKTRFQAIFEEGKKMSLIIELFSPKELGHGGAVGRIHSAEEVD